MPPVAFTWPAMAFANGSPLLLSVRFTWTGTAFGNGAVLLLFAKSVENDERETVLVGVGATRLVVPISSSLDAFCAEVRSTRASSMQAESTSKDMNNEF